MSQHIAPTYGNFVDLNRAEGRILTLTIESALTAQRLGIPYQDPLASINPRGIALYKVSGVNSWTDWVNYLAKSVTIPLQDLTLSRFGGMTDPNGYPILYGNLRLLSSGEACYQCGGVPEPYPILFFYDGMLADALLRGYRQVGCADCRTAAINMVAGVKQHYNQTGKSLPYLSHAVPSGIRFKGTSYDQILNNFWSRPLLEIYEYTGDSQTKQIALSLLDGSTDDSSNWTWSFKQAQQLGSASESQSAQALLAGLSAGGGGTIPPPPGAPTLSLFASPTSITSGGSSTLSWSSTNATSCSASGAWTGSKSTSGSQVVTPTVTSTYSLTCTGSGGSASQSTTVTVTTTPPPTTAKFKAGDRVQTTDNLNVRASAGADSLLLGTQPTGSLGTVVTGPTVTPLYTWWNVDFDNAPDGWVIENYLVLSSATPPPPPPGVPSVTISAYPTSINTGQSSTLSWSSVNTTSCSASGSWDGDRPLSGTQVVTPTITSTYIITCLGGGTSTGDLVTVTVTSTPTPPPPSSGISIGDWIQVTEKVSVRYLPATDSKRLGVQYVGTKGKVIGGPAQGSGYTWWNIDYTVVPDGWSVENYITETTAPSPVAIGSRVTTTDNIKVRSAPNGERIGRQPAGSQGTITAGPIQSGGYTWWNVNFDSGTVGWAAGSNLAGQEI